MTDILDEVRDSHPHPDIGPLLNASAILGWGLGSM